MVMWLDVVFWHCYVVRCCVLTFIVLYSNCIVMVKTFCYIIGREFLDQLLASTSPRKVLPHVIGYCLYWRGSFPTYHYAGVFSNPHTIVQLLRYGAHCRKLWTFLIYNLQYPLLCTVFDKHCKGSSVVTVKMLRAGLPRQGHSCQFSKPSRPASPANRCATRSVSSSGYSPGLKWSGLEIGSIYEGWSENDVPYFFSR